MRKTQFAAIVVAVLLVAGCSSSGDDAPQLSYATPAPTGTFEANASEMPMSADQALAQARAELAPQVAVAGKRFEKYLQAKGASSDLSRQLLAMLYVCEAKGLNRYDVAYAESYYLAPAIGVDFETAASATVYELLDGQHHLMFDDMAFIDMASCKNYDAIVAMH